MFMPLEATVVLLGLAYLIMACCFVLISVSITDLKERVERTSLEQLRQSRLFHTEQMTYLRNLYQDAGDIKRRLTWSKKREKKDLLQEEK